MHPPLGVAAIAQRNLTSDDKRSDVITESVLKKVADNREKRNAIICSPLQVSGQVINRKFSI
jgi:hypothetical protein